MGRMEYGRFGVIGYVAFLALTACATSYRPPASTEAFYERLAQQGKGGAPVVGSAGEELKIEVLPMADEKVARSTLGVNPRLYNLLALFLKVRYSGQDPIKVDLVHSYVSAGKDQHWFAPAEVALERIGKDDSAAMIGFTALLGPIGGLAGAVVGAAAGAAVDSAGVKSTTIEEHYFRQRFGPTILFVGDEGAGVVFFDVTWEEVDADRLVLSVPVINLNTNETKKTEISFPVKGRRQ
jgi:hypothetical protein